MKLIFKSTNQWIVGIVAFLFLHACTSTTDPRNPYNLEILNNIEDYQAELAANPDAELVNLIDLMPDLQLDIRYASTNNFTGTAVYPTAEAYLRKPAAEALARVQTDLHAQGLALKVYDAYRPYAVTLRFYEVYPDTLFVAAPWKGSVHNTACAVDVSLIDLNSGEELEMPTLFDDFTEQAAADYPSASAEALKNRSILIEAMKKQGFEVLPSEWWHYNYTGYENFELLDISFDELSK